MERLHHINQNKLQLYISSQIQHESLHLVLKINPISNSYSVSEKQFFCFTLFFGV